MCLIKGKKKKKKENDRPELWTIIAIRLTGVAKGGGGGGGGGRGAARPGCHRFGVTPFYIPIEQKRKQQYV